MKFIIFGLIVFLVGLFGTKGDSPLAKAKGVIILAGVLIMGLSLLFSSIRQIDAGHVGVKDLFGEVQEGQLHEGLNLVNPLVVVHEMSIQTQNYTMSSTYNEGQQAGDDAVRVLSKDGLEVIIDLTVLYRVQANDAPGIYRKIGLDFESKVIRPITRTKIREIAVYYNATDLYTDKREEFENKIITAIDKDFKDRGFVLEQLLVRKINLPASVKEKIEQKIAAIQEAERMEYVLQKETQEAERKRVEAKGNADAQRIVAEALTDKVLQFEYIKVQKELATSPNSKIILMGNSKNSPPIILGK